MIYLPYDKIFWVGSFNYIRWLLKEVLNSAWQVSNIAWSKNIFLRPTLEQIKAQQDSDLGVVIYANSITITPGTVTIANQGNDLLVHALDVSFMDDLKTGQMEHKVKKIIRPN
jgi:multicomponent Na+:H+ antiporter subunit E